MAFDQARGWKIFFDGEPSPQNKAAAAGITVWIVNLDWSKAFDRVHWPTLWETLQNKNKVFSPCSRTLSLAIKEWIL